MKLSHICENSAIKKNFISQCRARAAGMVNDTEGCSICAKESGLCSSCWYEWVQRNWVKDAPSQQEEIPDNYFDDTEDEYRSIQDTELIRKITSKSGFKELSHKYKP
jgi:hypothetical protein